MTRCQYSSGHIWLKTTQSRHLKQGFNHFHVLYIPFRASCRLTFQPYVVLFGQCLTQKLSQRFEVRNLRIFRTKTCQNRLRDKGCPVCVTRNISSHAFLMAWVKRLSLHCDSFCRLAWLCARTSSSVRNANATWLPMSTTTRRMSSRPYPSARRTTIRACWTYWRTFPSETFSATTVLQLVSKSFRRTRPNRDKPHGIFSWIPVVPFGTTLWKPVLWVHVRRLRCQPN